MPLTYTDQGDFIPVPDPLNPPVGAIKVTAATLNAFNDSHLALTGAVNATRLATDSVSPTALPNNVTPPYPLDKRSSMQVTAGGAWGFAAIVETDVNATGSIATQIAHKTNNDVQRRAFASGAWGAWSEFANTDSGAFQGTLGAFQALTDTSMITNVVIESPNSMRGLFSHTGAATGVNVQTFNSIEVAGRRFERVGGIYDAQLFGIRHDSTSSQQARVQAAINFINGLGGGVLQGNGATIYTDSRITVSANVFIRDMKFRATGNINPLRIMADASLDNVEVSNVGASSFANTTAILEVYGNPPFTTRTKSTFRKIKIIGGTSVGTRKGEGIKIFTDTVDNRNVTYTKWFDVSIDYCDTGLHMMASKASTSGELTWINSNQFFGMSIAYCNKPIHMEREVGAGAGGSRISNNEFYGLQIEAGGGANPTYIIRCDGAENKFFNTTVYDAEWDATPKAYMEFTNLAALNYFSGRAETWMFHKCQSKVVVDLWNGIASQSNALITPGSRASASFLGNSDDIFAYTVDRHTLTTTGSAPITGVVDNAFLPSRTARVGYDATVATPGAPVRYRIKKSKSAVSWDFLYALGIQFYATHIPTYVKIRVFKNAAWWELYNTTSNTQSEILRYVSGIDDPTVGGGHNPQGLGIISSGSPGETIEEVEFEFGGSNDIDNVIEVVRVFGFANNDTPGAYAEANNALFYGNAKGLSLAFTPKAIVSNIITLNSETPEHGIKVTTASGTLNRITALSNTRHTHLVTLRIDTDSEAPLTINHNSGDTAGSIILKAGAAITLTSRYQMILLWWDTSLNRWIQIDDTGVPAPSSADPWTYLSIGSDFTDAVATFANVSSFTADAASKYIVEVFSTVRSTVNTSGGAFTLDVPSDATVRGYTMGITATTSVGGTATEGDGTTSGVVTAVRASNVDAPFIAAYRVNTVTAGTVALQARGETSGDTFTVEADFFHMRYRKI